MANEKIEVGYRHIGSLGVDYHHKFLLYTDKTGKQYTISGWTGTEISEKLPLGKIHIETGLPTHIGLPYDARNPDNPNNRGRAWYRDKNGSPIAPQKQYRELITEAPDLSQKWAAMVRNAKSKDNIYPYDFLNQNSNTLADVILKEAGLKQPEKDGLGGHLAPGSGNELNKNIVPKDPNKAEVLDLLDLSAQNNRTDNLQYAEQSAADKLQALIQGFKNDKDGTFTAKALADNVDVVANFRDELRETLKQNQAQEVAQNTPQVQEERSYGGRSFG